MGLDMKGSYWIVKCDHCDDPGVRVGTTTKVAARKQALKRRYELIRTSKGSRYVYDDVFCSGCMAEIERCY